MVRRPASQTILLLSFCYHVPNFFWLLLIKRCPLPTEGRSFALNFRGTGSSNENNVGDSEFAWWRGPAVYEWVHTCLRQIYNLNFFIYFSEYAGEISPSLRNGIYAILIGSTALTMCCFGLYCRIYVKSLLDCCETCCRHKRGQHRVPTSWNVKMHISLQLEI